MHVYSHGLFAFDPVLKIDQLIPYPLINIFEEIRTTTSFLSYNVSKVDCYEVQLAYELVVSITRV